MKRFGDSDTQHEDGGTGQAKPGLKDHDTTGDSSGGCFYSARINTDGAPRGVSAGSMDWAKVNHDGFKEV